MPRLYRLSIAVVIVLMGAALLSRVVGAAAPNPLDVLFTNPDGSPCQMPCLFGVRPGQMTVDQSLQILAQHPLTRAMHKEILDNGVALESQGIVLLIFSNDGTRINWLNLERYWLNSPDVPLPPPDPRLASTFDGVVLGNIVRYFGVPAGLEVEDRSNHLLLWTYFPDRMLSFGSAMGQDRDRELAYLDIDGALQNLFVYPTDKDTQYPDVSTNRWLGFTSLAHYLRVSGAR